MWQQFSSLTIRMVFYHIKRVERALLNKRSIVGSILLNGPSCSLGYFPFQPVVHNWFIKGRGMYCSVYGKVHIKDPLLLIKKSSLCVAAAGFLLKSVST